MSQILIIDLGSQYTEIIRRSLRYLGFRSIILPPEKSMKWIKENSPKGIILSGGSASVYENDAPRVPEEILSMGIPVLGICFGMQWMAYAYDKEAVHHVQGGKSYGPVEVSLGKSLLFKDLPEKITVWASHGDSVKIIPPDFEIMATSEGVIEGMQNEKKKIFAVQFHPEVEQTEDDNKILFNFAENICGCRRDYSKEDIIEEIRKKTKEELGDGTAIIGVSGGVDSTTLAAILSPVLGDRLKAFMIDTGGMRMGEIEKVKAIAEKVGIKLEVIDKYADRFISEIGTTIDAEEKRAKFRKVYGEVFKEVAENYKATHMIQGTLATDLIESSSKGGSALIKTHHNVDLDLGLKEIMPLSDYFKFEVRDLAYNFGLDELVAKRQPFPGPGLYLRILGTPVTKELLDMAREADDIVRGILEGKDISQTVVALLGAKTVGVKGDARVYGYSFVVRTVRTEDFMTVKGYYLDQETMAKITSALTKHPMIVRVMFDFTTKPPATVEFE